MKITLFLSNFLLFLFCICVGMYVCAYICMYVCMFVCMYIHVWMCASLYLFIYLSNQWRQRQEIIIDKERNQHRDSTMRTPLDLQIEKKTSTHWIKWKRSPVVIKAFTSESVKKLSKIITHGSVDKTVIPYLESNLSTTLSNIAFHQKKYNWHVRQW